MLDIQHLTVRFAQGTPNAQLALNDLSLALAPGEFATIVGSNGAGKSTLFSAICGGVEAASGRIALDGQDITHLPEHKRALWIGRLFQDPMKGTAPDMTVAENLALAYARRSRSAFARAITKDDLALFQKALGEFDMGLEKRMRAKVGLLSGGQRQAMTLLMCTIARPKLLLLDEHTAALDPATAQTVLDITRKIVAEQRLTALMITHNLQQALALGTRTIMMDKGQVVLDVSGAARAKMTVDDLLAQYARKRGQALDNDRILLSGA